MTSRIPSPSSSDKFDRFVYSDFKYVQSIQYNCTVANHKRPVYRSILWRVGKWGLFSFQNFEWNSSRLSFESSTVLSLYRWHDPGSEEAGSGLLYGRVVDWSLWVRRWSYFAISRKKRYAENVRSLWKICQPAQSSILHWSKSFKIEV